MGTTAAILGSSVSAAFKSEEMVTQLDDEPGAIANFVIWSASPGTMLQQLDGLILKHVTPKTVVCVLSSRDINLHVNTLEVNASVPDLDRYASSRASYWFVHLLKKHVYLYRYRLQLQQLPRTLVASALGRGAKNESAGKDHTPLAAPVVTKEPDTAAPKASNPVRKEPAKFDPPYKKFSFAPKCQEDLDAMRQICNDHGSELLIVLVPVSPAPNHSSENYREAEAQFFKTYAKKLKDEGVHVLLLGESFPDASCYRDLCHLSKKGSAIATQKVAGLLSELQSP